MNRARNSRSAAGSLAPRPARFTHGQRQNGKVYLSVFLLAFVLGIVAFLGADCACGTRQQWLCVVSGRQYIPPWTEVSASTDSDGQTHVYTINHSPQWRLFCSELVPISLFLIDACANPRNRFSRFSHLRSHVLPALQHTLRQIVNLPKLLRTKLE